jgi:hypothetical protein
VYAETFVMAESELGSDACVRIDSKQALTATSPSTLRRVRDAWSTS